MTNLNTIKRNDAIKNDFKILYSQHVKKEYVYKQLAEKYFLGKESIQRIVTDQYNKAFAEATSTSQPQRLVIEIILKNSNEV